MNIQVVKNVHGGDEKSRIRERIFELEERKEQNFKRYIAECDKLDKEIEELENKLRAAN